MKAALAICAAIVFISCSHTTELSTTDRENIRIEIQQTLSDYYRDIQKNGLLAEFNYLDSSDEFFWVPPGFKTAISYDSVAIILRTNAPALKSVVNRWDSLLIIPLAQNLASYTGRLHSIVTDTSGKVFETDLVETGTLVRRGKKWKLLCGQTNALNTVNRSRSRKTLIFNAVLPPFVNPSLPHSSYICSLNFFE